MSKRDSRRSDVDVAIVGGSVVGLTLASLLLKAGFKVAVIEAGPERPLFQADEPVDLRVFAITRASERILASAGAWPKIASSRLGNFRSMQVWDEQGSGRISFDARHLCEPTLGYIVENRLIQSALEQALQANSELIWHRPAKLEGLQVDEQRAHLFLQDGKSLSARLVAGADGAFSRVRELCGIDTTGRDYQQTALVCNVSTEQSHEETARQRFLQTGPLAFLPLQDKNQSSIVWSTTPQEAERLLKLTEAEFRQELASAFEHALGAITACSDRAIFPLNRAHAEHYVRPRIALLGDAAHRIHPLAGQGANLGLLDAASLAEILIDAEPDNLGSLRVLRRYERWRRGDNLSMMLAMDAFKDLFSSKNLALRLLRNAGMDCLDQQEIIKSLIMKRAMGLMGDLPVSARS